MSHTRNQIRRTVAWLRAAAVLAGLLGLLFLALAATVGAVRIDSAAPRPAVTANVGDDNGDGAVDEDEPGWNCHTMGNRICGTDVPPECDGAGDALALCVRVASRPPFGWLGANGEVEGDLPDGRTLLRDLWVKPGDPDFADYVAGYDADWDRVHHS
ncbi:hypothetical protein [Streptomyces sp. NPDC085665]|uniref:hypothetical protein n=1 Tax=Streptomyces sp. NPDC085665 TaxID=3365735 RepID=UPI0037CFDD8F